MTKDEQMVHKPPPLHKTKKKHGSHRAFLRFMPLYPVSCSSHDVKGFQPQPSGLFFEISAQKAGILKNFD
jgi:hypothetical protein